MIYFEKEFIIRSLINSVGGMTMRVFDEKKFVDSKREELIKHGGIILLDSFDDSLNNEIVNLARQYTDVDAFIIEDVDGERVVFRNKRQQPENLSYRDLIDLGNRAYKEENYRECIRLYLQLLQFFPNIRSGIFSTLGLSNLYLGNIPSAIDYLTIANALAKKEGIDYDYARLIDKLKKTLSRHQEIGNPEKNLVEEKYRELIDKGGIILLDYLDDERVKNIVSATHFFYALNPTVIDDGKEKMVVLRLTKGYKSLNISELITCGNSAYKEGNYDECINIYSRLLQCMHKPKPRTFMMLGLAYWKKGNLEEAVKYLRVATLYARMLKQDFDFTEMISKFQMLLNFKDSRSNPQVSLSEFGSRSDYNHFGIENFYEINAYIRESKLSVESACQKLGMSESQIAMVELIYAREFYRQGNISRGDLFLKAAQKHKNKTSDVVSTLAEISKNKMFYKNDEGEESRRFVLDFYPKVK